ncbi:hypothetical protein CRPAC_p077 (plastid) [Cryptomonas paramecium]|uniref:Uncharacterized protein n=1 Tax=Cryptomonas paramaecium TaxID=2898 RepID=D2ISD7_9CRYP|nr:hypothetical protein CRPAC_p077 [Cryptomonas paramecium]ACT46829.1 hypothetical protein CRPAC_p077 [Cryptomonas paramecium]BDA97966.1 hypothetical protein [Cryptomonas paramecium]
MNTKIKVKHITHAYRIDLIYPLLSYTLCPRIFLRKSANFSKTRIFSQYLHKPTLSKNLRKLMETINFTPGCAYLKKIRHKLNSDLKYISFKSIPTTCYLDTEGRTVGQQSKTEAINLLERASNKIETLVGKNILQSNLFGSISFSQV